MKTLYKPLGLLFGVVGGLVAGEVFRQLWKHLSGDDEAPDATDPDQDWREVLLAAAIQGAVFGLVRAAIDRGGANAWQRLTGVWPGGDDDD